MRDGAVVDELVQDGDVGERDPKGGESRRSDLKAGRDGFLSLVELLKRSDRLLSNSLIGFEFRGFRHAGWRKKRRSTSKGTSREASCCSRIFSFLSLPSSERTLFSYSYAFILSKLHLK
jgi:hypothetical protein